MTTTARALDGVRVLELARFQAGPRGGMILSDLGAEVIKIEPPGGEETRRHPPIVRGQSVYFSVYNRGKKSICLDLRSAQGKEVFAALVAKADIVLENFRPGVMAAIAEQTMMEALARGWGDKDSTSPWMLQEEAAGVKVRATP